MSRARQIGIAAALVALAGVAFWVSRPAQPPAGPSLAAAASGCRIREIRTISFTSPTAPDTLEAHAFGPDCERAIVALTLRDADGHVLYEHAEGQAWPLADAPTTDPGPPERRLRDFLAAWATIAPSTTASLPPWPKTGELVIVSPTDPNDFVDASPLGRAAYVRARDAGAPMLCHALPDARRTCLIHDRATGAVTVIYSTAL